MTPLKMERPGLIMEPMAGEANEVEGVLNSAVMRDRDGQLYLFPRLVGKGNSSRIGASCRSYREERLPARAGAESSEPRSPR
jgi:hypothetical protein